MSSSPATVRYTEPWLRGTHADVPAAGRAVLHALELSLDDLTKWTAGLSDADRKRAEIAAELALPEGEVVQRLTRLLARLGTSSRAEATSLAFRGLAAVGSR